MCNYLRRYKKIPRIPAIRAVEEIKAAVLYQSVRAELIQTVNGRLPPAQSAVLARYLKSTWSLRYLHPDLVARLGDFLVRSGKLSAQQISDACSRAPSWWSRATLIESFDSSTISQSLLEKIALIGVQDRSRDTALVAAWKIFFENVATTGAARRKWNKAGELLLKETGVIQRLRTAHCGITLSFEKLNKRIPALNWKVLFGNNYNQAERQSVKIVADASVNITGFVNLLDVFNDLLIDAVFRIDRSVGNYSLGSIGSVLNARSKFAKKFPFTFAFVNSVHDERYKSMYSHPRIKRTGKPTKKIEYSFLAKAKRLMSHSFAELSAKGF